MRAGRISTFTCPILSSGVPIDGSFKALVTRARIVACAGSNSSSSGRISSSSGRSSSSSSAVVGALHHATVPHPGFRYVFPNKSASKSGWADATWDILDIETDGAAFRARLQLAATCVRERRCSCPFECVDIAIQTSTFGSTHCILGTHHLGTLAIVPVC